MANERAALNASPLQKKGRFLYPLASENGVAIEFALDTKTGQLNTELTAPNLSNNHAALLAQISKYAELITPSGVHRFIQDGEGKFSLTPPLGNTINTDIAIKIRDVPYGFVRVAQDGRFTSKVEHQLTAFETRVMAQGRNGVYPLVDRDTNYAPRTDLHTHFAGALTGEALVRVALAKEGTPIVYPSILLNEAGIDTRSYGFKSLEGQIALKDLTRADRNKLAKAMSIQLDTQDTFNGMEKIYALRGPITKNTELFKPLLWETARDSQKNGVTNPEPSFSAMINDSNLMRIAHEELPKIQAATGVKIRFLAGMWRHSDNEWNLDEADRIKAIAKSPYVAGVDIMGHETNPTRDVIDPIKDMAKWAMKNDPDFVIRVHAGENPLFAADTVDEYNYNNVREALKAILDARAELAVERGVAPGAIQLPNIRIGHGLYGADQETVRLFKETNATVEFNMSSNLSLNNVDHLGEIPLVNYQNANIKLVLGTDGAGIYRTTSPQEALLAKYAGLDANGFSKLREVEAQHIDTQDARATTKAITFAAALARAEQTSPDPWKTVFTPEYSTADGKPRMSDAVAAKKRMAQEEHLQGIRQAIAENGIVTDPAEVIQATAGKKPIMITGASKSSWPKISESNQHEIRVAMQLLADNIDPARTYLITGGTNFGVEKQLHEAVARHNAAAPNDAQVIALGTLTTEAKSSEIESGTVTHAQIVELNGRPAARWFDLPDATLNILERERGIMIAVGGGPVVRDMIQRGHNGRNNMLLMNGPEGASTEKTTQFESRGYNFEGAEALLTRLYAQDRTLLRGDFNPKMLATYRHAAEERLAASNNETPERRLANGAMDKKPILSLQK